MRILAGIVCILLYAVLYTEGSCPENTDALKMCYEGTRSGPIVYLQTALTTDNPVTECSCTVTTFGSGIASAQVDFIPYQFWSSCYYKQLIMFASATATYSCTNSGDRPTSFFDMRDNSTATVSLQEDFKSGSSAVDTCYQIKAFTSNVNLQVKCFKVLTQQETTTIQQPPTTTQQVTTTTQQVPTTTQQVPTTTQQVPTTTQQVPTTTQQETATTQKETTTTQQVATTTQQVTTTTQQVPTTTQQVPTTTQQVPTTTQQVPTTTQQVPTTTQQETKTTQQEPTTTQQVPTTTQQVTTTTQVPTTTQQVPTTTQQVSTTTQQEPTTTQQVTTTTQQIPTTTQQESTTTQQESTTKQHDSTTKQESTTKQQESTTKQQESTTKQNGPNDSQNLGNVDGRNLPGEVTKPGQGYIVPIALGVGSFLILVTVIVACICNQCTKRENNKSDVENDILVSGDDAPKATSSPLAPNQGIWTDPSTSPNAQDVIANVNTAHGTENDKVGVSDDNAVVDNDYAVVDKGNVVPNNDVSDINNAVPVTGTYDNAVSDINNAVPVTSTYDNAVSDINNVVPVTDTYDNSLPPPPPLNIFNDDK